MHQKQPPPKVIRSDAAGVPVGSGSESHDRFIRGETHSTKGKEKRREEGDSGFHGLVDGKVETHERGDRSIARLLPRPRKPFRQTPGRGSEREGEETGLQDCRMNRMGEGLKTTASASENRAEPAMPVHGLIRDAPPIRPQVRALSPSCNPVHPAILSPAPSPSWSSGNVYTNELHSLRADDTIPTMRASIGIGARVAVYLAVWLLAVLAIEVFLIPDSPTESHLTPLEQRLIWPLYTPLMVLVGLEQAVAWAGGEFEMVRFAVIAVSLAAQGIIALAISRRDWFFACTLLQVALLSVGVVYFIHLSRLPSGG